MSRNKHDRTGLKALLIILMVVMIAASGVLIYLSISLAGQEVTPGSSGGSSGTSLFTPRETEAPTETDPPEPERPQVVATATVGTMGDLLMHEPVISSCRQSDGSYDFESIFRYMAEYLSACDYAVANLETTLGGTAYPYQGNPEFNCPDSIVDSARDAGFDMLLTANNHCSDTHTDGLLRTLEQVRGGGLATLGTQLNDEEDKYAIVDVNGIRIGMVCYTYADSVTSDGRPSLNYREAVKQVGLVNYFTEGNLDKFYSEIQNLLSVMKEQGAEATMVFIHWGKEYQLTQTPVQSMIAQNLCNLGVDVIVGGHPHVIEPMDLLESTVDPDHKTVCIYSLGNAVSNQRLGKLSSIQTAHTEDGALFTVTFEKYSDGTVYVADTNVLPAWVNMSTVNGKLEYNILPLDFGRREEWQSLYNLTDSLLTSAQDSYGRTMEIVGAGLTKCQTALQQAKAERDGAVENSQV